MMTDETLPPKVTALRMYLPVSMTLEGAAPAALERDLRFNARGSNVTVHFEGESILELPDGKPESRFFRRVKSLACDIEDAGSGVIDAVVNSGIEKTAEFIRKLANRILRAVRNFGETPHIEELPSWASPDGLLRRLRAQRNTHGVWTEIVVPPEELENLLVEMLVWSERPQGTLKAVKFSEVEEALQDGREAGPEQEFFVNSIEHLRRESFRLAVVEAVVCLEITLSTFLRTYLSQVKAVSEDRINAMLSPEFGLTARISGLLDLTLDAPELKQINRDRVMDAIKWRNAIAHRTGNLPSGVKAEQVTAALGQVFALVAVLSFKRRQIELQPVALAIAQELTTTYGFHSIVIAFGQGHAVNVWVNTFPQLAVDDERLLGFVSEVSEKFVQRDGRFDANRDLEIVFTSFGTTIATWKSGKFARLHTETSQAGAALLSLAQLGRDEPRVD